MRDIGSRIWATGLAALVLGAGLTACTGGTGGGDGRPDGGASGTGTAAAKACGDGTYSWSAVKESDRLTGVSERERLGAGGGALRNPLERVYTPRPSVRTEGPTLSPAEVLFSLGKKIGEVDSTARTLADDDSGTTYAFTDVHVKAPPLDNGAVRLDGAGDFVTYDGVREVAGDFRYSCPDGRTTTGHARTWRVVLGGIVNCGEAVEARLARQAARLSCETGSAATKGA